MLLNKKNPIILLIMLLARTANVTAQHCGGPCEVPRGADPVSPNPMYTLSEGIEADNWRYLYNWFWTENGVQKHRVESSLRLLPARDFGYRRMFVSPSGNGFLVTGNAYAGIRRKGQEPPLFVFFDPMGNLLTELSLFQAFEANERKLGPCPTCGRGGGVLYVFADNPHLSDNGCFVELKPYKGHDISFFLPFGCPVRDQKAFEDALEEAEWSKLPADQAERQKKEIATFLDELNSEEFQVRNKAAEALLAKGFLARSAISSARYGSTSGNFRSRAGAIARKLRPLSGSEWEAMSTDLHILGAMLSYNEAKVVEAVRIQLKRVLPQVDGMTNEKCVGWIKEHQRDLKWNAAKGQYEE